MSLQEIVIQQLFNGLLLGSFYGLVALGYSMVYGIIRLLNFAHADEQIAQLTFLFNAKKDNCKAKHINACG